MEADATGSSLRLSNRVERFCTFNSVWSTSRALVLSKGGTASWSARSSSAYASGSRSVRMPEESRVCVRESV